MQAGYNSRSNDNGVVRKAQAVTVGGVLRLMSTIGIVPQTRSLKGWPQPASSPARLVKGLRVQRVWVVLGPCWW